MSTMAGAHAQNRSPISLALRIPLLLLSASAVIFSASISYTLIARGVSEDRIGWIVLGGAVAFIWLWMAFTTGRKALRHEPGSGSSSLPDPGPSQSRRSQNIE